MIGEVMPHHIGKLVTDPDGERECALPIAANTAAAFKAERLLAADAERSLDHDVGIAERRVDVAVLVFALDEIIVLARVMNERCIVLFSQARIRDRRQWLIVDLDELASVFRGSGIFGDNGANCLAAEAYLVDGQPVLNRLPAGKPVGHAAKRIHLAEKLFAREYFYDAGQLPRFADIDVIEARV